MDSWAAITKYSTINMYYMRCLQLLIAAAGPYNAYRTPRDNLPHVRPQAILNPFRTQ